MFLSKEICMKFLHTIQDEMLVHVPLCVHAEPSRVVVICHGDDIAMQIAKHKDIKEIIHLAPQEAIAKLTQMTPESVDIVIIGSAVGRKDKIFWGLVNRVLTQKGLAVSTASSLLVLPDEAKEELEVTSELFRIVMPYRFEGDKGQTNYALLVSKFYHPTADINLQRADLTDGFDYYNSDIAIAAFAMPTMVRKKFLNLIKS